MISMNPAEARPEPVTARTHWGLAVLTLVYAMSLIDRQIMGVLIEPVKAEFGVSDTAMGLLSGLAFALLYSALGVPFARYADRANRRNFVAICCAGWSVMTAVCGLAANYWQLALARMGVAVGEAGGTAPALSMITDYYPPASRSRATSVFMLGPHFGTLVGLGLGAWIAHAYGWRAAFIWMALPGPVLSLLLWFSTREPRRGNWDGAAAIARAAAPAASLRDVLATLWRDPIYMRLLGAAALLGFGGYAFGIWNTAFLVRSHGLNLRDAGILVGLVAGLGAIFGALFSGWLTDRLASRDARWQIGVPVLGTLIAMPMVVLYLLWPADSPWVVGPLLVPQAMAFGLAFSLFGVWWTAPVYVAIANLVPADRRATSLALITLVVTAVGGGLGPLTVGLLSDALAASLGKEALRWAILASLVGFVLATLLLASAIRPYQRAIAAHRAARAG